MSKTVNFKFRNGYSVEICDADSTPMSKLHNLAKNLLHKVVHDSMTVPEFLARDLDVSHEFLDEVKAKLAEEDLTLDHINDEYLLLVNLAKSQDESFEKYSDKNYREAMIDFLNDVVNSDIEVDGHEIEAFAKFIDDVLLQLTTEDGVVDTFVESNKINHTVVRKNTELSNALCELRDRFNAVRPQRIGDSAPITIAELYKQDDDLAKLFKDAANRKFGMNFDITAVMPKLNRWAEKINDAYHTGLGSTFNTITDFAKWCRDAQMVKNVELDANHRRELESIKSMINSKINAENEAIGELINAQVKGADDIRQEANINDALLYIENFATNNQQRKMTAVSGNLLDLPGTVAKALNDRANRWDTGSEFEPYLQSYSPSPKEIREKYYDVLMSCLDDADIRPTSNGYKKFEAAIRRVRENPRGSILSMFTTTVNFIMKAGGAGSPDKYKGGPDVDTPTEKEEASRKYVKMVAENRKNSEKGKAAPSDSATTRKFTPNFQFSITKLKSAIREDDFDAIDKELKYVMRDIEYDASELDDMQNKFVPNQLKQILAVYQQVIDLIEPLGEDYAETADKIANAVKFIEIKWGLKEATREQVMNPFTGEVFVADAPEYGSYVTIDPGFNFSYTKIQKAIRHGKKEPLLIEYPDIIKDLDEDIADEDRLKKFTKKELREVTDKYREIIDGFKKLGLNEEAAKLEEKYKTLYYNTWHLGVEG